MRTAFVVCLVTVFGCSVTGPQGEQGPPGANGETGKTGDTGLRGPPGLGADQAEIDALEAQVEALATEIGAVKSDLAKATTRLESVESGDCPLGYTRVTADPTFKGDPVEGRLCQRGLDQMVRVGNFWIDRFEAFVTDEVGFNGGRCDSPTGGVYFREPAEPDGGFVESGAWTARRYACSCAGSPVSRQINWFRAQQACALAGKRLPTNSEWQAAVAGTQDPEVSSGADGTCVTYGSIRQTGLGSKCTSNWGAEDMIGNVWEWVDDWTPAGPSYDAIPSDEQAPWPAGYGDGKDATHNVVGLASGDGNQSFTQGLPAAPLRGGGPDHRERAGAFTYSLAAGPNGSFAGSGFRCARSR